MDQGVMRVAVVVVTYRRVPELRRLLASLEASDQKPWVTVIVDHDAAGALRTLPKETSLRVDVLENAANPGPGGGWAMGARHVLEKHGDAVDAVLFLDDDAVMPKDGLGMLWDVMEHAAADAIAPLLSDAAGRLWAFPEPAPREARKLIRRAVTPEDALRLLGPEPLPFCWATGACLLVRAAMIRRIGFHREDFWMLGEDLEYAMRIAAAGRGVFTCRVVVPHLPPTGGDPEAARRGDYIKTCSLLQNLSYLSFHGPLHSHMWRYLPGNTRRFLRTHGVKAMTDALACLISGAVAANPAGRGAGPSIRSRLSAGPKR